MSQLTKTEQALVAQIRRKTSTANRNNLTRTVAYLDFYQDHPEVHWALLAHLVSRNGGWNMTDLRGDWLPYLMPQAEIESFFLFLERCNFLIFHDAYAQLLLYQEMKHTGEDLTDRLPLLGVSRFMDPIWRDFLQHKDSAILTKGLIINEQQYIHQRVVHQSFFQENVFGTFEFKAQSILSLSQVLFPYKQHPTDKRLQVIGIAVHNFPSVEQRISIGKFLYSLLYGDQDLLEKVKSWAYRIPHTGSRADYWPHLFSPVAHHLDEKDYKERMHGMELLPDRPKLYSPTLTQAWKDVLHPAADGADWYRDAKWLDFLGDGQSFPVLDNDEYALSLNLVELGLQVVSKLT